MALKGYHSYRGRQGAWRWLLTIVLVLVLIAACSFLLLQRYIVYSDDGSFYIDLPFEFDLNLPFLSGTDGNGEENETPEQDVNLIVDPPRNEQNGTEDTAPEPEVEPEVEPEQLPAETYIARRLVPLEQLLLNASTLSDGLAAAGADGFVFLAKNRQGYVLYQSSVAAEDAMTSNGISREMISQLCAQEGVYTVARINCMRDSFYAAAHAAEAGICKSNGGIWYEHDLQDKNAILPPDYDRGGHWMDAEKEAARNYLISLAVECAQLGFDELMLENVCYPYRGNLYKIDYSGNTMSKTEALVLFLEELNAALEPYGVRVSLVLEEDTVRGLADNTEDTGFVAQRLLPLVDAVYVSTNDEDTVRHEMNILLGGQDVPALVPIVSEARADGGWYIEK